MLKLMILPTLNKLAKSAFTCARAFLLDGDCSTLVLPLEPWSQRKYAHNKLKNVRYAISERWNMVKRGHLTKKAHIKVPHVFVMMLDHVKVLWELSDNLRIHMASRPKLKASGEKTMFICAFMRVSKKLGHWEWTVDRKNHFCVEIVA